MPTLSQKICTKLKTSLYYRWQKIWDLEHCKEQSYIYNKTHKAIYNTVFQILYDKF